MVGFFRNLEWAIAVNFLKPCGRQYFLPIKIPLEIHISQQMVWKIRVKIDKCFGIRKNLLKIISSFRLEIQSKLKKIT